MGWKETDGLVFHWQLRKQQTPSMSYEEIQHGGKNKHQKHPGASLTTGKVMLMQVTQETFNSAALYSQGCAQNGVCTGTVFTAKLRNACLVSASNLLFIMGKWKYFKCIIRTKPSINIPAQWQRGGLPSSHSVGALRARDAASCLETGCWQYCRVRYRVLWVN